MLTVDLFMKVICFLLPPVAWMLYAFNAAASPKAAKQCMVISLIGWIIAVVILLAIVVYECW